MESLKTWQLVTIALVTSGLILFMWISFVTRFWVEFGAGSLWDL